jgi:uncharacterized RDD family membrane protein YckC
MYNTGFKRFLAAIFDWIILASISYIQQLLPLNNINAVLCWIIFYSIFCYTYSIYCHYRFGQTAGKYFMNIKVFDISESKKMTFMQAILRDSFGLVVLAYSSIRIIIELNSNQVDSLTAIANFNTNISNILGIWAIIELLTMLFNKKRRAIHDYIAGTVVIKYNK